MMTQTHYHVALITALIMFVAVLVINTLANTLPINNQTTGQISNQYPNLFQPSGMTFSIWGLIYLSLGAWIVYQLFQWQMPINESSKSIIYVLHAFSVSSLFNILWLLSWHYNKILLSTIVMLLLLGSLIVAYLFSKNEMWLIQSSISLYLGWISVATIANITILLVSLGAPSEGQLATLLTVSMLIIGLILGLIMVYFQKDIVFGFVFIWAYFGIYMRHLRLEDLNTSYPIIIYTSGFSALLILIIIILSRIIPFIRS
ncbi:MAG TPA: lantibiotic ABC transporter permease [Acholeplasmataceae bacterium]|nr:lantibiotic ABC transporter permease [Acholeplasmataceae bacterium]HBO67672.1 lantibiotic ABC transporter permease [Acholeplasmataceae bacterium]HBS02001.1 lantibiotic ABC transporter permease [Acholeplasmataceae bacterium]HCB21152.1 lantibiotic ABC transporter permease [Acholeplasmataceae bacterium]